MAPQQRFSDVDTFSSCQFPEILRDPSEGALDAAILGAFQGPKTHRYPMHCGTVKHFCRDFRLQLSLRIALSSPCQSSLLRSRRIRACFLRRTNVRRARSAPSRLAVGPVVLGVLRICLSSVTMLQLYESRI